MNKPPMPANPDTIPALVEAVARAIYAARPFCMASTMTTFGHQIAKSFDWDGAPAYYQSDIRELAAAAIAAMPDASRVVELEKALSRVEKLIFAKGAPLGSETYFAIRTEIRAALGPSA